MYNFFILICIIICLIFYIFIIQNIFNANKQIYIKNEFFKKIHFKTGDLILFQNKYNPYNKYVFGDTFTHIGIIINYDGNLCILHCGSNYLTKNIKSNIRKVFIEPLYNMISIRNDQGKIVHLPLKNYKKDITIEKILEIIPEIFELKHRIPDKNYMNDILFQILYSDKYIQCSELIIKIYERLNIIKSYISPIYIRPQHILYKKYYKFKYEYNFGNPVIIKL